MALNRALADFHWRGVSESEVRRMIGGGAPILIERATAAQGLALDAATQAAVVERFFHHYGALQDNDEFGARPYPGAAEALKHLHGTGVRIAIVTNQQQRFASGLLRRLRLRGCIDLVVGGDTCERRKPDPQPLLLPATTAQATPGTP